MKEIPQNIWETDCRHCLFRLSEENFPAKSVHERPCKIMLLIREKSGHCASCRPNEGFGICRTCRWFNVFHDEDDKSLYCTHIGGPLNRRNTKPLIRVNFGGKESSETYNYFTCDRYIVEESRKEYLIDKALRGKIAQNFDPETWKPLEYIEGEPAKEWKKRQQEHEDGKPENARKRKLREKIRQKTKRIEE